MAPRHAAVVWILTLLAGGDAAHAAEPIGDQTRLVNERDPAMNAAIAEARRTLDNFLAVSRQPPPGASGFKLKVMLSDEHGTEHVWFIAFKEIDGGFAGVLANEPRVVTSVTAGKVYPFKREQVSDWGYVLDGKQIGSYTVCALFKTMPPELVARYKQDHGFVCAP